MCKPEYFSVEVWLLTGGFLLSIYFLDFFPDGGFYSGKRGFIGFKLSREERLAILGDMCLVLPGVSLIY